MTKELLHFYTCIKLAIQSSLIFSDVQVLTKFPRFTVTLFYSTYSLHIHRLHGGFLHCFSKRLIPEYSLILDKRYNAYTLEFLKTVDCG